MKSVGLLAVILLTTMVMSVPHHHRNDPYSPVIRLLKQIRKAHKHGGHYSRDGDDRIEDGNYASAGSGSQSQSSSSVRFPSSSSSNQDYNRIQINLPNLPPAQPRPTSSPADIRRINDGVSTILQGVGSLNLAEILRGSFKFTRNENVRDVANNVIRNIFGDPSQSGGSAGGAGGAESREGRRYRN